MDAIRLNEFNARLAVTSGQSAHLPTTYTLSTHFLHTHTHTQQEHPSELQANRFAFDVLITIHAPHRPQCLLALIAVSIAPSLSISLVLRLRCKWQLICNPFYLHLAAIKVNSCITCCLLLLFFVVGVLHKRENISSSMSFLYLLLPPTRPLLAYQIFSWQVAGA